MSFITVCPLSLCNRCVITVCPLLLCGPYYCVSLCYVSLYYGPACPLLLWVSFITVLYHWSVLYYWPSRGPSIISDVPPFPIPQEDRAERIQRAEPVPPVAEVVRSNSQFGRYRRQVGGDRSHSVGRTPGTTPTLSGPRRLYRPYVGFLRRFALTASRHTWAGRAITARRTAPRGGRVSAARTWRVSTAVRIPAHKRA